MNVDYPKRASRRGRDPVARFGAIAWETVQTLVLAFLIAILIRGVFLETYMVYGLSMEPSLHEGERLLVNKLVYRFRAPSPGEIVVFTEPGGARNLVKRVVATAGQHVEMSNGQVFIDGVQLAEDYLEYAGNDSLATRQVPADSVFVLGDNRTDSQDSRYFGAVPLEYVNGRALIVFWPLTHLNILGSR